MYTPTIPTREAYKEVYPYHTYQEGIYGRVYPYHTHQGGIYGRIPTIHTQGGIYGRFTLYIPFREAYREVYHCIYPSGRHIGRVISCIYTLREAHREGYPCIYTSGRLGERVNVSNALLRA